MFLKRSLFLAAAALLSPGHAAKCPDGCTSYFDGCNTCSCDTDTDETTMDCTEFSCGPTKKKPKCLAYLDKCPLGCTGLNDGCNQCGCNDGWVQFCTEKWCKDSGDFVCESYDCKTKEVWTDARKEWCCTNEKKGCEYNCKTKEVWTDDKKRWCCKNEGRGCKYDCNTDEVWTDDKTKWCCKNEKKGCKLVTCPNTCTKWNDGCNDCDCKGGLVTACTKMACENTDEPACISYNCNTKEVWSDEKTEWCCKNKEKGYDGDACPMGCTNWINGCNSCSCDGFGKVLLCTTMPCSTSDLEEPHCSVQKNDDLVCPKGCKNWFDGCNKCKCKSKGVVGEKCTDMTCVDPGTPECAKYKKPKYDCNTKPKKWDKKQKKWCCANKGKGCKYDCDSKDIWSKNKVLWCCKNLDKGCLCEGMSGKCKKNECRKLGEGCENLEYGGGETMNVCCPQK